MAFIWRRRPTSIVKIVLILTAIWFTIAFFIYTDDGHHINQTGTGANSKWHSLALGFKASHNSNNNNGGGTGSGTGTNIENVIDTNNDLNVPDDESNHPHEKLFNKSLASNRQSHSDDGKFKWFYIWCVIFMNDWYT